jgi:tight adherence protein C
MCSRGTRAIAVAAAVLWTVLGSSAASADDGTRITITRLDISAFPEVRIVAAVTDRQGHPLKGLTAADLTISEGGVAQPASIELASQAAPVAIALVLDTSGSMGGRPIADAKAAMVSLIQALAPADQAAVITFDATVRIDRPLTSDKSALITATNGAVAGGNTAIYDGLAAAVSELAKAPRARRAIILLTDGFDNSSRQSASSVLADLANSQTPVYVIGLGTDLDRAALSGIASATAGGRFIEAPTSAQLAAIYSSLSEQLLTQYSITYRSAASAIDGAALSAEVTLRRGDTLVASTTISFRVPAGRGIPPATPTLPKPAVPEPTAPPKAAPIETIRMPPELVGLLGAAAVLTLLLWVSELASRFPSRQRRRLEVFVRALTLTSPVHDKRRSVIQRVIVPSLRSAGRPLLRITPAGMVTSTRERLQAAGEPMGLGPSEFLGVRTGVAMIGAIGGLVTATAVTGNAGWAPLGALGGALVGFVLPGIAIDRIANGRQNAIRRALPASLDMLALGTEAGLSFDGAIGQVAHRWETPLSEELRRVLVEFQMGRDRKQALRELGRRTGVPELMRFASAVIQADSLGVPLSRVLHEQSAEIRVRRRQRAEEAARKAPVKMLFPMVALIFPALFVVILGPAIPRLLEAFQAFN